MVEQYKYSVYGKPTILAPDGITERQVSAIGNTRLFAGAEYDSEIESYNCQTSNYSPGLGRSLQMDAAGNDGLLNQYNSGVDLMSSDMPDGSNTNAPSVAPDPSPGPGPEPDPGPGPAGKRPTAEAPVLPITGAETPSVPTPPTGTVASAPVTPPQEAVGTPDKNCLYSTRSVQVGLTDKDRQVRGYTQSFRVIWLPDGSFILRDHGQSGFQPIQPSQFYAGMPTTITPYNSTISVILNPDGTVKEIVEPGLLSELEALARWAEIQERIRNPNATIEQIRAARAKWQLPILIVGGGPLLIAIAPGIVGPGFIRIGPGWIKGYPKQIWRIAIGGRKLPIHMHIWKGNWYKPWKWFQKIGPWKWYIK